MNNNNKILLYHEGPSTSVYIFSLIITLIIFLLIMHSNVLQHEAVHKTIFDDYGISSRIEYYYYINTFNLTKLWNGEMAATIANREEYNKKCDSYCILAQENVDAFGYNFSSVYLAIFLALIIYIIFKFLTKDSFTSIIEVRPNGKPNNDSNNSQSYVTTS